MFTSLKMDLRALGAGHRKSVVNRSVKASLSAAALAWHQRYYEGHFTRTGAIKYAYQPRTGQNQPRDSKAFWRSYTGRKLRKVGHADPLKFTGDAYRRGKVASVRATSKQAKVVLPNKFNWKHPKSRIVMRDELTRVLPGESDALRGIAEIEMGRHLTREEAAA